MFCFLQNIFLVYCLQTNHRYCWSLWLTAFLFQWHSYAGRATINDLNISTSCILQLGSYHSHKSKTIEGLKLNLAKHHRKYLQISYKIIHTKWSYSLKNLLWFIVSNAFCRSTRIMLGFISLSKPFKVLSLRDDRNRSVE